MNAQSEKEYVDTQLQAINGRLDRLEHRNEAIESSIRELREALNIRFAQLEGRIHETEAKLQRSLTSMLKWIVGTVIAIAAISVSIITAVLLATTPRTATPAVIYIQPPVINAPPAMTR